MTSSNNVHRDGYMTLSPEVFRRGAGRGGEEEEEEEHAAQDLLGDEPLIYRSDKFLLDAVKELERRKKSYGPNSPSSTIPSPSKSIPKDNGDMWSLDDVDDSVDDVNGRGKKKRMMVTTNETTTTTATAGTTSQSTPEKWTKRRRIFPSGLWPHMDLDLDYGCRVVAQHITVPQSSRIVKGFSYDGIVIKRISIKDGKEREYSFNLNVQCAWNLFNALKQILNEHERKCSEFHQNKQQQQGQQQQQQQEQEQLQQPQQ